MECNTAHTQCTIGLARRPCQELTGWTELCQSHYNEYNPYTHEVVWKKIVGVWRRSVGGGPTCAETVLGHNLRHRKSIMDVIVPFIPDSVIALAELYAFRQHLCSGSIDKGYAKLIFGHFWIRRWEVALSLFASYLMGRVSTDWRRTLMVALWLCIDTIALVIEILLSRPHATRRAPAKIVTAIMEALLAFGVIAYLGQLILSLKGQGKWIWLAKLASLGAWSLGWGVLSLLYWLQLTSDLAIMVWLITYAALFHYSAASPDASSSDTQPPLFRSPWLAVQRWNREVV
ncbi:hypothetical protein XENOCAPTIV_005778 [Xenoophorus captivus]|uniref:Uncharacterized protein n=1 Tax=Xenoophorus captivus TaxID=1517983 RepID=A0ABV0SDJ4_9TELE